MRVTYWDTFQLPNFVLRPNKLRWHLKIRNIDKVHAKRRCLLWFRCAHSNWTWIWFRSVRNKIVQPNLRRYIAENPVHHGPNGFSTIYNRRRCCEWSKWQIALPNTKMHVSRLNSMTYSATYVPRKSRPMTDFSEINRNKYFHMLATFDAFLRPDKCEMYALQEGVWLETSFYRHTKWHQHKNAVTVSSRVRALWNVRWHCSFLLRLHFTLYTTTFVYFGEKTSEAGS